MAADAGGHAVAAGEHDVGDFEVLDQIVEGALVDAEGFAGHGVVAALVVEHGVIALAGEPEFGDGFGDLFVAGVFAERVGWDDGQLRPGGCGMGGVGVRVLPVA